MNVILKALIVVVMLAAVAGVMVRKHQAADPSPASTADAVESDAIRPTLIELGAGKCMVCKAMKPIIDQLQMELHGQLQVTTVDVQQDPQTAEHYGIRLIPTQIFLDARGAELFRHEGFYSREDILGKWRELGYEFQPSDAVETGS